ncbi:hypothetical protein CASFOL_036837 [Castilleja foliolosa]|uniref:RING-type E3 ubiquitin transferase n=1 Tax=Castilleja foliolosa TaxID=1961234 RepID=A0ABD3BPQ7_9LAMI
MGGCCCCCAHNHTEINRSAPFLQVQRPVSDEREPFSSHHGLLVDTYLDTSFLDTYQPPPAPIPYETYVDPNTSSTIETKVKNIESDEHEEIEASNESEDERSKKSSKPVNSSPEDEDDFCPICLEEYDAENPKIITKCYHHFHLACILEWMERSNTCAEMFISPDEGG